MQEFEVLFTTGPSQRITLCIGENFKKNCSAVFELTANRYTDRRGRGAWWYFLNFAGSGCKLMLMIYPNLLLLFYLSKIVWISSKNVFQPVFLSLYQKAWGLCNIEGLKTRLCADRLKLLYGSFILVNATYVYQTKIIAICKRVRYIWNEQTSREDLFCAFVELSPHLEIH